jgi:hypothetical protein
MLLDEVTSIILFVQAPVNCREYPIKELFEAKSISGQAGEFNHNNIISKGSTGE